MERPTTLDAMPAFTQYLAAPDNALDLGRAALLIALAEYPDLDIDAYVRRLDGLAVRTRARLALRASAQDRLLALNRTLFEDEGFAGNTADYYDPRNSFLNDVLDRKLGIPITLSILYMEVGRRLDLPVRGVSFPGHFLVKVPSAEGDKVVDPFNGGRLLREADLRERIAALSGTPTHSRDWPEFLQGAGKREILARMLRNLKAIYLAKRDWQRVLSLSDWILTAVPDSAGDIRERGLLLEQLACPQAAAADYRRYLELAPTAADATAVDERLRALESAAQPRFN